MRELLLKSNNRFGQLQCCHSDSRICNCYDCFNKDFYDHNPDTYECLKKLCYYVMHYGPAFASEVFHFLRQSQILEENFQRKTLKVASLGCGFGPDRIALTRYIEQNNLNIELNYVGIDAASNWGLFWEGVDATFKVGNVLNDNNDWDGLSNLNILFMNKLFSTLHKHQAGEDFLRLFEEKIFPKLTHGSFVVFHDVNDYRMGRDAFHETARKLFGRVSKFFFNVNGAYTGDYAAISSTRNIFIIPPGISVTPRNDVTKSVFFQYQK